VIGGECYGDEDEVCLPFLDVVLHGIGRLCAEPCGGSDLGLPH
jgi:hypothetical protein